MILYFDESYDQEHEYLLLGVLFNPHPAFLHHAVSAVKKDNGYVYRAGTLAGKTKEIKYSGCSNAYLQKMACQMIDQFVRSTSWFRCVVVDQRPGSFDLDYFGHKAESENIKKARAYKKFAEMLLDHNCKFITNATLLTDRLTRCRGDLFLELLRERYCAGPNCTFRALEEVDTALEQYQLGQVNDILIGCVLNALKPAENASKNQLRQYAERALGISLSPHYWSKFSRSDLDDLNPKFGVWAWKPK
jgi:hypothetical protein